MRDIGTHELERYRCGRNEYDYGMEGKVRMENMKLKRKISIAEVIVLGIVAMALFTACDILSSVIDEIPGGIIADITSPNIGLLKVVPAGSFQRDGTAGNISIITTAFHMSEKEITRAQFIAIMGDDPSGTGYSSGTNDPVQRVNWYHAISFCNKLSISEGLDQVYSVSGVDFSILAFSSIPTSSDSPWNAATADWSANGYRLPTEMEWMWAAMGAEDDYTKLFAGSNGSNAIGDYAWYSVNSDNKTHPAGTKLSNELGLYDMSGNVWEWCWDWYGSYPGDSKTDYRGAASGSYRVVRGGSWYNDASYCTVAFRSTLNPHLRSIRIGFRVVRP